jgi:hypothetical protein
MTGSATLTTVLSRPTINRLEQQMTSTSMLRRRLSSGSGITLDEWSEASCVSTTNVARDPARKAAPLRDSSPPVSTREIPGVFVSSAAR